MFRSTLFLITLSQSETSLLINSTNIHIRSKSQVREYIQPSLYNIEQTLTAQNNEGVDPPRNAVESGNQAY